MTTEVLAGAGGVADLPPTYRVIDRGPSLGPSRVSLPSYEETFADGVAIAKRRLFRLQGSVEITDATRLAELVPSSLKRLAAMNDWAELYQGVILQDPELELLNGTTVGRLVSFMQRKRVMAETETDLNAEELAALQARVVTPPELSDPQDVNEAITPEAIARRKAIENRFSDQTANLLLTAMNDRLALV